LRGFRHVDYSYWHVNVWCRLWLSVWYVSFYSANISNGDVLELELPVPPVSLQREFARRVTAVEALKTAQRASLAELDALFATLQHRAFKGEL
jgi:hypothetical protein